MKKNVKLFCIIWILAFIVFNAAVFAISVADGAYRFENLMFWITYALVVLSYVLYALSAVCLNKCGKLTLTKRFIIFTLPVVSAVVGVVFDVVFTSLISVIGGVISLIMAIATIIIPLLAKDKNQQHSVPDVNFITLLSADAETLVLRAVTVQGKILASKVYDAIRYSDPVSSKELCDDEKAIKNKYDEFKSALSVNSSTLNKVAEELFLLIAERNAKCKVFK